MLSNAAEIASESGTDCRTVPSSGLLEEITVVELGGGIAAGVCGRFLLQLGARVISVEPKSGSPLRAVPPLLPDDGDRRRSAVFAWLHASKELVQADPTDPADHEVLRALISSADVVLVAGRIDEWRPTAFSPADLAELAPNAVIGRVTLFGDVGPYAQIAGGEVQLLALGGLMNVVGRPDREPLRLGGHQAQASAGLAMLSGVLIGLFQRQVVGRGATFTTSVLEAVAHTEWKSAVTYQDDGAVVSRGDDPGPLIVRCRDGFFAFFYLPGDWEKVKRLIGDPRLESPDFATFRQRRASQSAIAAILADATADLTKRDLYLRAQQAGIPAGYMATMGDLLTSPHYMDRRFFEEVDLGEGRFGTLPGPPWKVVTASAAPTVGASSS